MIAEDLWSMLAPPSPASSVSSELSDASSVGAYGVVPTMAGSPMPAAVAAYAPLVPSFSGGDNWGLGSVGSVATDDVSVAVIPASPAGGSWPFAFDTAVSEQMLWDLGPDALDAELSCSATGGGGAGGQAPTDEDLLEAFAHDRELGSLVASLNGVF